MSCWPTRPSAGRPGFTLGLGTGPTADAAARSAALEVAQVYRGLAWALYNPELSRRATQLAADPGVVAEPFDHGLLYAMRSPQAIPRPFGLAPPRGGARFRGPGSEQDVLYVDLTSRDIVAATSFRVVRVVAPSCIPLHIGCRWIPLGLLDLPGRTSTEPAELLHPLS